MTRNMFRCSRYPRDDDRSGFATNTNTTVAATSQLETAFPGAPYEKFRQAIKELPDFIPAMDTAYADPKNVPGGPDLGYRRQGKFVDTAWCRWNQKRMRRVQSAGRASISNSGGAS